MLYNTKYIYRKEKPIWSFIRIGYKELKKIILNYQ